MVRAGACWGTGTGAFPYHMVSWLRSHLHGLIVEGTGSWGARDASDRCCGVLEGING